MSFSKPSIIRKRNSGNLRNSIRRPETSAAHKSVERCLESSFDMEADAGRLKRSTSVATSGPSGDVGLNSMSIP